MKNNWLKTGLLLGSALLLVACGNAGGSEDSSVEEPTVAELGSTDGVIDWDAGLDADAITAKYEERQTTPHEEDTDVARAPDDTKYVKIETLEDALEFNESGTGILYFGWEKCPYCLILRQDMDLVLEDLEQPIYMLEQSDFSYSKNQQIYEAFDVMYTPSVLVYKDGEEVTRMGQEVLGEPNYLSIYEWFSGAILDVRGELDLSGDDTSENTEDDLDEESIEVIDEPETAVDSE